MAVSVSSLLLTPPNEPQTDAPPNIADVLGMLSFALDMTQGQSPRHTLRGAWIGAHVAQAMELDARTQQDLLYTQLLKDSGCSSNATMISKLFETDDIVFKRDSKRLDGGVLGNFRFILSKSTAGKNFAGKLRTLAGLAKNRKNLIESIIQTRCEQGSRIAHSLGMTPVVQAAIEGLDEHWDGSGAPTHASGNAVPLLSNIALLSQVVDVFHVSEGIAAALREAASRRGSWFRPDVVNALMLAAQNPSLWAGLNRTDIHRDVLQLPAARASAPATDGFLDTLAETFSMIIDAKSSYTADHSKRVAHYADIIASELGLTMPHRRQIKHAALLHNVGKLAVSSQILDKPTSLNEDEWINIRDHPIHSERILAQVSAFRNIAEIAGAHHERIDGTGYPYGRCGTEIPMEARILSVAIAYDALSTPRPQRDAIPILSVFEILDRDQGRAFEPGIVMALRSGIAQIRARAS